MTEILGIDEVGRGCLAGPLVVGAVILDGNYHIEGLKDSKQLSKARCEVLAKQIMQHAKAYALGWVSAEEIDELDGLTPAMTLAIRRALAQIDVPYDQIIIDGSYNFIKDNPKVITMPKADSLAPSVSAASIIAKVARDNYMIKAAKTYPGYGFERHVGYDTELHRKSLALLGICELHRLICRPVREIAAA